MPAHRFTTMCRSLELTSTLLALHSLCDVLVIDCPDRIISRSDRELLGRDDVRRVIDRVGRRVNPRRASA
ncbi:MAG: hypothetical protein ACLUHE_17400 [Christensenellales bacterium]